jgi:hypothetical protein
MKTSKPPLWSVGSDRFVVSGKHTDKVDAVLIGIFFILATVSAIIGLKLYHPIPMNQNFLMQGTAHSVLAVLGAVVELMLVCIACGTALLFYPYLRVFKERLGMAYFCFLVMEALFILGIHTLIYSYVFYKSGLVPRKPALPGITGACFVFMISW